jgi:predicted nucleic acid-binding protein
VDASAAVELLLRREAYEPVAALLLSPREILHAPHLLDVEVTHVLRRLERGSTVTATRAREALEDLRALRLVRHAHLSLLERAWELRDNLSAYDAMYVALAESLGVPLVTMDGRLAGTPGHVADVVVPG